MNLCSSGHEEVCFESRKCPGCEVVDELNEVKRELLNLQADYEDLKKELSK